MKIEEPANRRGKQWKQDIRNTSVEPLEVDFGTYHHSTPQESNSLRERSEVVFSEFLKRLYPSDTPLQILDAGCGLGFLMYVAARCFPKADITGVDLFRHNSMSEMSIDKAKSNMTTLGIESRTSFLKHDLTKPLKTDARYDLAVSNVVFHNMGKKRFSAYEMVFHALRPGAFFVIGDLFPRDSTDRGYLLKHSTLLNEMNGGISGPWEYKVMVLQVNQ